LCDASKVITMAGRGALSTPRRANYRTITRIAYKSPRRANPKIDPLANVRGPRTTVLTAPDTRTTISLSLTNTYSMRIPYTCCAAQLSQAAPLRPSSSCREAACGRRPCPCRIPVGLCPFPCHALPVLEVALLEVEAAMAVATNWGGGSCTIINCCAPAF
jgi:hypothetical protein